MENEERRTDLVENGERRTENGGKRTVASAILHSPLSTLHSPFSTLHSIVEIFYSLQGEGRHTGMPAVFVRLAGCHNACPWCDAKETWNAKNFPRLSAGDIAAQVNAYPCKTVIVTGGEPLLHPLDELCARLKEQHCRLHLETSGAAAFSGAWDWVCLSPKRQQPPLQNNFRYADELKVVIATPDDFAWAEENARQAPPECLLLLQPEWSRRAAITPLVIAYILRHPQWRLSLQTHKFLDIP
jgi:organic radical activating enzyme